MYSETIVGGSDEAGVDDGGITDDGGALSGISGREKAKDFFFATNSICRIKVSNSGRSASWRLNRLSERSLSI